MRNLHSYFHAVRAVGVTALLSVFFAGLMANTAMAKTAQVDMEHFIVTVNSEGEEVFTKAEQAAPGDVIEYRLIYSNNTTVGIDDYFITGPIPNDTQYVPASAKSSANHELKVSIDDGATWDSEPVRRTQTNAEGVEVEVVIPESKYKKLRWYTSGRLQPNEKHNFSYRIRVDQ